MKSWYGLVAALVRGIVMPRDRQGIPVPVENDDSRVPFRNWTYVVEAMPAVVTMMTTITPTMTTPPSSAVPAGV